MCLGKISVRVYHSGTSGLCINLFAGNKRLSQNMPKRIILSQSLKMCAPKVAHIIISKLAMPIKVQTK